MEFHHRRRKSQLRIQKDTYIELNRSVSLFFIITKFLAILGSIMLVVSSDDYTIIMLVIEEEDIPPLHSIPDSLILMQIVGLCILLVSCIGGLYGYASMKHYMLFYYATSLIIFAGMFLGYTYSPKYRTSDSRKEIFLEYKLHKKNQRLLDMIHKKYECCGCNFYKFEDMDNLPETCCANLTAGAKCTRGNEYKKICDITALPIEIIEKQSFWPIFVFMVPFMVGFFLFEAFLALHLLYYLRMQKIKSSLARRSSMWTATS